MNEYNLEVESKQMISSYVNTLLLTVIKYCQDYGTRRVILPDGKRIGFTVRKLMIMKYVFVYTQKVVTMKCED